MANLSSAKRVGNMNILFSILAVATLAASSDAHAREVVHKGDVVVVPLRGEISPSLLMFLRRAEKAAETNGASAIIFEMNTYGGRLGGAQVTCTAPTRATMSTHTVPHSDARSPALVLCLPRQ